jgi:error-prone DNA polymerase
VAGLGTAEIGRLLAARPLVDLADLRDRVGVDRTGALALAEAGALDQLGRIGAPGGPRDRRSLRLAVEETWSSRRPRRVGAQQTSLLLLDDVPDDLPVQSLSARVRDELGSTGVELSAHVVSFYAPLLAQLGVVGAHQLREVATGARVRVAGVRVALQSPPQRSGDRVMFLTLDDRTGQVQVTFFARALPDCAFTVSRARLVVAEGVVARRGRRGATVVGRRAWDLTLLWAAWQDGCLDVALRQRGTPAPHLPAEIIAQTAAKYREVYERLLLARRPA